MMMKLVTAIAAAIATAGAPAPSISSHDGSWHSVEAKSSWSDGHFPKGFSLTISLKFDANKLSYHSVNDTDAAHPVGLDWAVPLDDTIAPIMGNPRFNQIRIKRLSADDFQVLEQKDGDVIVGQFWTFSKDGKTLVRRGVGKSPEGKSKAFEEFFVRQ